ncbi:hypothetical protein BU16DRAFT_253385 [Lophium mytilinum]|uniref:GDS1 winged helix domain-containing protein n=1 Tax=Lophium mytilinum TaxID=390894 RepID=A0A6A6RAY0_9PEZI|nr:hypothetical protein BU16DRAFT_253385 [Lophium mytilinum]
MPYNTRRKSLSLPSLGIHLPNSSRSAAHRSPPASAASSEQPQPAAKKVKRSHPSASPQPSSPERTTTLRFRDERPKSSGRVAEHTPPPSPGGKSSQTKVSTEGIDDTIVVGVIEQLEKTGNRPHLLKELAAVLATSISIVESSANPSAIISSRLATYLRRPWTALSQCPLDKVLVGTHPKRVYYYLTTSEHQPIPTDSPTGPAAARIISPSLSSAASEEEEADARTRSQLSPSPELDLSSPDFEDDSTPFSNRNPLMRGGPHPPTTSNISHNRRAVSPPLERDEHEFTQTASILLQRSRSQDSESKVEIKSERSPSLHDTSMQDSIPEEVEETEESAALRNSEAAAALFGHVDHLSVHAIQPAFASSSPMLKPHLEIETTRATFKSGLSDDVKMSDDETWGWSELKSPENVELDELEDMFGEY